MNTSKKTPWVLLSWVIPFLLACQSTPDSVVEKAFDDLCGKQPASFATHLTTGSSDYFLGALDAFPKIVACAPGDVEILGMEGGKGEDEETAMVTVKQGDDETMIVLVKQDGEWKIDLFFTERMASDRRWSVLSGQIVEEVE